MVPFHSYVQREVSSELVFAIDPSAVYTLLLPITGHEKHTASLSDSRERYRIALEVYHQTALFQREKLCRLSTDFGSVSL
jgi:hypothetical protein